MNYVELYPGDYMRDTADLSLVEHGAYLLLLLHYYSTETAIPSDNPTLFRIARAMSDDEKAAVSKVAERFFPVMSSDGLRHNVRADEEIAKARARIDSARENGKRGGRPKKPDQNPTLSNPVNPNGTQHVTGLKAPHTPHAIKEQEQSANPPAAAFDFKADLFARWKAMPGSGGGAFLNKLFRDHKPEDRVVEAVERTLAETRADPKAFVLGVLNKPKPGGVLDDDLESALAIVRAQDFSGCI